MLFIKRFEVCVLADTVFFTDLKNIHFILEKLHIHAVSLQVFCL